MSIFLSMFFLVAYIFEYIKWIAILTITITTIIAISITINNSTLT